jgi:hypothetical protein
MAKPRPCVQCGVIFLPEFPRGAARTCSEQCSHARRKAVVNAASKRYGDRNRAAVRTIGKQWRERNRSKAKANWQAWAKSNRAHINAQKRARYAERLREAAP